MEVIDEVMKDHLTVKHYIIDKTENSIFVYLGHFNIEDFDGDEVYFYKIQHYTAKLMFEKSTNGLFKAKRFCQLSSHYGWITLETSDDLQYLAEKFCYHIDKESLLEFWIEGEEDW